MSAVHSILVIAGRFHDQRIARNLAGPQACPLGRALSVRSLRGTEPTASGASARLAHDKKEAPKARASALGDPRISAGGE
jgi:hypothetical protein